ncbi:MAG TPA: HDOD domain-containing protein [Gammaproteobacteria bacterium]|nr:HDOD domain-containing protein [Gammaproteobacteria bacterium]
MSQATLTDDQMQSVMRGMAIPVQPQIMVDLQMEQAMPDPDIKEIARLISRDVELSGSVLKAVNSPFFGLRNTITSIQKAVMLLGINSVINMVNSIAIRSELSQLDNMSDEEINYMNLFWDAAQDVALVSTTIVRQIGFISPDEAYTLGLFHNSGIPLLAARHKNYHEIIKESYSGSTKRIVDVENERLDTNHSVVGFYLAKSWKLSPAICDAIGQHHNTIELFGQGNSKGSDVMNLLAVLKLAEHIVGLYKVLGNTDTDIEWNETRDLIFQYLSISEDDFDEINITCQENGIGLNSGP